MGCRRLLSVADRIEISTGLKAGWSLTRIASSIGRATSVVSREILRNATKTRGYQVVTADVKAERRRSRPQARKVAVDPVLTARVLADLGQSRTPRQIAGRLRLEAADPTVGRLRPGSLTSPLSVHPRTPTFPRSSQACEVWRWLGCTWIARPRRSEEPEGPFPAWGTGLGRVELRGFEPLTFSLRTRRATNCAIAPCGCQD